MKGMAIAAMAAAIALLAVDAPASGGTSRPGLGVAPNTTPPAGMPSFYQPSYSIDRKEWWQPHPYFQSNGQGYGYPSHPGHQPRGGVRHPR